MRNSLEYYASWDETSRTWDLMVSPSETSLERLVTVCPDKETADMLAECMNDLILRVKTR